MATRLARPEGRTDERLERRSGSNMPFRALVQAGGGLHLSANVLRSLVTRPLSWGEEFVGQSAVIVRRCLIPLALSSIAFQAGVGVVGTGERLELLGATDRLGGGIAVASTREFSTWITGMLVAGIAGTAISSDLGARKVRGELDALAVIGVEPIRSLVLPRYLALASMSPLLFLWTAIIGAATTGLGSALVHGVPIASYVASFSTLPPVDVYAALIKVTLVGLLTASVFCFKGLTVSGGAEGVGRAVNQAVVIVFVAIWTFNFLFNATYLAVFPESQGLR